MSGLRLIAIDANTKQITHPSNANKGKGMKYKCIDCKEDVIFKQGDQRAWHFSHKTEGKCECNPESQIHKTAKSLLKHILDTKIKLTIFDKCKCKKFTVIPEISDKTKIVKEYKFSHNNNPKIADVAYLDDNGKISYIFEICYSHKTNESDRPEPWFELDAKDLIDKFINSDSKSIEIHCIRDKKCNGCGSETVSVGQIYHQGDEQKNGCGSETVSVGQIYHQGDEQKNEIQNSRRNGVIYFNQRGAGCGKTYESIQLMDKDERFIEKTTFIYLTKMHSAKEVIFNELKDQEKSGKLTSLESSNVDSITGKQYRLSYKNISSEKEIEIIIGTIDSFTFAIVNKSKIEESNNYFNGILKTIMKGEISVRDSTIRYAGAKPYINNNCLIIIDEAQDLGNEYIQSFNTIIEKTDIDVYVIGDKLQSILGENNIYTEIDNNKFNTEIIRSDGINKVMRFHNNQFINFVNTVIPFEKYGLPKITEICSGNCKYKHEDDKQPYELFQMPSRNKLDDYNKPETMDKFIDMIISYMKNEINNYGYLPNNFMFIFPILTSNNLAIELELRIQKFWIKKFDDVKYQDSVLCKDIFWKDKINDKEFYKYVHLHKSDEGKSINLKESENATRILSIHASKGNGCEVVFVLGINEKTLTIFSKDKCNLQYDSLLHVAITRQKKSIYMGIELNNDDINDRFKHFGIKYNPSIKPDISCIKQFINMSKIKTYLENDREYFDYINEMIIIPNKLDDKLPVVNSDNPIIDFGHHMIRYSVMFYNFTLRVISHNIANIEEKDREYYKINNQFYQILRNNSNREVELYNYKYYIKKLHEISKNNKNHEYYENKIIPLLMFKDDKNSKYYKYAEILQRIIKKIQMKIKKCFNNPKNKGMIVFPALCPLESVILLFVIKMMEDGVYIDISIMDIYTILFHYDNCFSIITENDKHTEENKCICKKEFNNKNNTIIDDSIKTSIVKHYESISAIDKIYKEYKSIHKTITDIKYLIFNKCWIPSLSSKNFIIMEKYDILGISDKAIVYFIFKPTFNKLNFSKTISDSIIDNYVLLRKHNGKKIYTCIITLDSERPIIYELNLTLESDIYKKISKYFQNTLFNIYSSNHELIYNLYMYYYHKNNKDDDVAISDIIKKLKDKSKPEYISEYFDNIGRELYTYEDDKNEREQYLLDKVHNKDSFITGLNKSLKWTIAKLLKDEIKTN